MAKILVVEDDQFFREAICDLLKSRHSVFQAPDGKSAKDIMTMQDFDLILSDIQMPNLTGIELLEWSKAHKPVPFVIMTGFSMVLETQSAFDLGAKGFIAKPFKNAELVAVIEGILGTQKDIPVVNVEKQEFCKVPIEEFVAKPKIDFDVYIKLSEDKIIKIARKGDEIPKDKVEHYKSKGVKYLHILKEDFRKVIDFNMNVAKIIKGRNDVSDEKKMNFMRYTGELILEKVFVDGLDKRSLGDAQSFLSLTLETVSDSDEYLNILETLNTHSNHVYAHSLGASLYMVMIAKKMGYESSSVLFKLAMAGLYHDIGKKEIEPAILSKPRQLLSQEERKIYETHVVRSQEILMSMNGMPEEVAVMAFEHHEDMVGLGFPLGKKKLELHPMSKILQGCNLFLDLTIKENGNSMTGPQAVEHMKKVYADRVSPDVMDALSQLFQK